MDSSELVNIFSLVVTAILVPVIGILTWTIKKFVTASIDNAAHLIENQSAINRTISKGDDEICDRLDRIELKLELADNKIDTALQKVDALGHKK